MTAAPRRDGALDRLLDHVESIGFGYRGTATAARAEFEAIRERERFFLTPLQLEQDGASVRLTFETKEHRETWCAHFLQRVQDANRDAALTPKDPHART